VCVKSVMKVNTTTYGKPRHTETVPTVQEQTKIDSQHRSFVRPRHVKTIDASTEWFDVVFQCHTLNVRICSKATRSKRSETVRSRRRRLRKDQNTRPSIVLGTIHNNITNSQSFAFLCLVSVHKHRLLNTYLCSSAKRELSIL
jgi:hypothetical protein